MAKTTLTLDEYKRIKKLIDEAEKDETPYASVQEDSIAVVGDANKTEMNEHNFTMRFIMPDNEETDQWIADNKDDNSIKQISRENGRVTIDWRYKNVFIKPRIMPKLLTVSAKWFSLFYKTDINDKYEFRFTDYGIQDVITLLDEMTDEQVDSIYQTVATILGVPTQYTDNMSFEYVLNVFGKLPEYYPELMNELYDFFRLPSVNTANS